MNEGFLNQIATIKAKIGHDVEGRASLSAGVDIRARFQGSSKRITAKVGQQVFDYVVDAEMYILPGQALALDDMVVLDSVNYKVVKIDEKRDLMGKIDHKKALLIRSKE